MMVSRLVNRIGLNQDLAGACHNTKQATAIHATMRLMAASSLTNSVRSPCRQRPPARRADSLDVSSCHMLLPLMTVSIRYSNHLAFDAIVLAPLPAAPRYLSPARGHHRQGGQAEVQDLPRPAPSTSTLPRSAPSRARPDLEVRLHAAAREGYPAGRQ